MVEKSSRKFPHLPFAVRLIIYVLIGVVFICGGIYLLFYLWFNWEYLRGNYVAAQAQGRVEQIYGQLRENVPNGVTLVSMETPQSGTYAWGLSDGSPRYAYVSAQQIYSATLAFSEVLTSYKDQFADWGWVTLPLNSEAGLISAVFRHPFDENLVVGICSPPENLISTVPTQYSIFFDFNETRACEWQNTRLGCIAVHYCN